MDSPRATHDVRLIGLWHNDGSAGLGFWCETCQDYLTNGTNDHNDHDWGALSVDDAVAVVGRHAEQED